jgi:hypothetical protein
MLRGCRSLLGEVERLGSWWIHTPRPEVVESEEKVGEKEKKLYFWATGKTWIYRLHGDHLTTMLPAVTAAVSMRRIGAPAPVA